MEILALYRNGETIGWDDRIAIRHLQSLPWPADHLDFVASYGDGEFVGVMRVHSLKMVMQPLLTRTGDIKVADLDDGTLVAALHVDRYLFEFKHRVDPSEERVFTSFTDVLKWALSRTPFEPALPLFQQRLLPRCSFHRGGKKSNIDDKWFSATVVDNAAVTMRTEEMAFRFSAKAGVLFELDDFGQATLRYRLDCKCVKSFKAALEAEQFVHPPMPDEDYYLQMYVE